MHAFMVDCLSSSGFHSVLASTNMHVSKHAQCTFTCSFLNRILFCFLLSLLLARLFCWSFLMESFTKIYICVAHTYSLALRLFKRYFAQGLKYHPNTLLFYIFCCCHCRCCCYCFYFFSHCPLCKAGNVHAQLSSCIQRIVHLFYFMFVFGSFQHLDLQKKICLIIDGMRTLLRDFHTHFFSLLFFFIIFSGEVKVHHYNS